MIDYLLEKGSVGSRSATFGWINKPEWNTFLDVCLIVSGGIWEIRPGKNLKKWNSGSIHCRDGDHSAIFIFIVSIRYKLLRLFSQSIAYSSRKLAKIKSVGFSPDQ
jgi:hypothetical protein